VSEQRFGFTYHLLTVPTMQGKALARSHGEIGGPGHNYVTIPWNDCEEQPGDPLNKVSLNNGWTFLYGPTVGADVFAHVRTQHSQAAASQHLRLYIVNGSNPDGTEIRTWGSESPERGVLNGETHVASDGTVTYSSTHLDGAWHVPPLAVGDKLRLEVDYWTAVDPDPEYEVARIVGGRVSGTYHRSVPDINPAVVARMLGQSPARGALRIGPSGSMSLP
jgi:hypothetical protein